VSAPNEQAKSAAVPPSSAGRVAADGRRKYRLTSPLIIWWTWIGVLVLGLGDLAVQGHDWISLKFGFGLLAVTGVIYACTFWPKVIADDGGISVLNPFRSFRIPWGAVRGVFLADSVEVECARQAPKKNKTVYSWALSSPRRARARQQLRGRQWDRGGRTRPSTYDRLPEAAKHVVKMTPAEVIARELGRLADEVRARSTDSADPGPDGLLAGGGSDEIMSVRWAWQPLAAIFVPVIAFAVAQLVR
jgi:Bacterial PH domain